MEKPKSKTDAFRVTRGQSLLERLVHGSRRLAKAMANLETKKLHQRIDGISVVNPVYIAGLARSGSTILLEALAQHGDVATHQYRDFPLVFTPHWSDEIQRRVPASHDPKIERAHGDGLAVSLTSPEAMEEPLWMAFFENAHDPESSHVLTEQTDNPAFEKFYSEHIRKLMLVRERSRYVAKGNYNLSRIRYLLQVFPDARVIVPVRHPRTHIASLLKQHRLFKEGEIAHPRATAHLQRVGHFEFGLSRTPINFDNIDKCREIIQHWNSGEEVLGWAKYWAEAYGWIQRELEERPELKEAVEFVRYEDLCERPQLVLDQILRHAVLKPDETVRDFASGIHAPTYYRPDFSADDEETIRLATCEVADCFGYEWDSTAEELPGEDDFSHSDHYVSNQTLP